MAIHLSERHRSVDGNLVRREQRNMSKRKSPRTANRKPLATDVPICDYFEYLDLNDPGDLDEGLGRLIYGLETGYFLTWEAVVRQEQGLPLTREHKKALSQLINFGDQDDDRILYVDEIPRPSEPWYALARKIVPRLLQEPYLTDALYYDATLEGWPALVGCLQKHTRGLSLPEGAHTPLDIFPVDLRHRLWLQACFDALHGLGQEDELTLANPEQQDRVEWFINLLREHKESVQYFDLTLDDLLTRVILPPKDRAILIEMMHQELNLPTSQSRLVEFL
jgi:hypothetical protein